MHSQALLLVGHGSSFDHQSSKPVYAHAARIRDCQLFDEVHVAFWKEQPFLRDASQRIRSDEVSVVPMFMAEGYFTRAVVPRELDTMHLCPPVGTHPCMPELVLKRANSANVERRETALVVIGHGTERSTTSSETVRCITRRLRAVSGFRRVECGFLDQNPRIEGVLAEIDAPHVVLVPFFIADGYHTRQTIPATLGLDGARTVRNGRVLWYTQAVGTMPAVAWAAVDLTRSWPCHADASSRTSRKPSAIRRSSISIGSRKDCRLGSP